MSNSISNYLEYHINEGHITHDDKENILEIYNNLVDYEYSDVFTGDEITTISNKSAITYTNELDKSSYTVSKCVNLINDRIIKRININEECDSKYKELIYIDFCKEIYFGKIFANAAIGNVIVPKIIKYGKICLTQSQEVSIFIEMPYYKQSSLTNVINEINPSTEELYNFIIEHTINMISGIETFMQIQTNVGLYHNDIPSVSYFKENLKNIKHTSCRNYAKHYDQKGNIYYSNEKVIVIDFGCTSRIKKSTSADYLYMNYSNLWDFT